MLKKGFLIVLFVTLFTSLGKSEGDGAAEVLIVFGSDTSIWDGMGTATFHDNYNLQLFVDPTYNAYKVMDATWREKIKDSYGTPVKFTWWMMAGQIFRYGVNVNVPIANTMGLYLMKAHHGAAIKQFGDELTLHYHTFAWTDYNADGAFYWNQAKSFNECRDDFDFTLAQYLLEENTFPVSFRSGWHYMDNYWQNHLDSLLPYSMHNDYPAKRFVTDEPIDNVYDWSKCSPYWVPFHPSKTNYQLPGSCKGWNLRSKHIGGISNTVLTDMFTKANNGVTQVACLWGHLPEAEFLTNIENIDKLAHALNTKFPKVKFRYCSAIEAMQRFQKSTDTIAPKVTFSEKLTGDNVTFTISTDEPIFQPAPFVAVKDIYERLIVVPCKQTGTNSWETTQSFSKKILAKAGVALTDIVGNQTLAYIKYLQDEIYIDNKNAGYKEIKGNWETKTGNNYFDQSLRSATLSKGDSAIVEWHPTLEKAGYYNLFYQTQSAGNLVDNYAFIIYKNNLPADTVLFKTYISSLQWVMVATKYLEPGDYIRTVYKNIGNTTATAYADVFKVSPLVKDKQIVSSDAVVNMGIFTEMDTLFVYKMKILNNGMEALTISSIKSSLGNIIPDVSFPLVIKGNSVSEVPIKISKPVIGTYTDTLLISSDDPINPKLVIPCNAEISAYFETVDNEESMKYVESGKWNYSTAKAFGATSRYSWLNEPVGAFASFKAKMRKTGTYEFFEIVPKTVNSSTKALYQIKVNGKLVKSQYIDQNEGSGLWVSIGKAYLQIGDTAEVKVINDGAAGNSSGTVIRADGIKMQFIDAANDVKKTDSGIPTEYALEQNFPNPFNSTTIIRFSLPFAGFVTVKVYDILGREIKTLAENNMNAGTYNISFNADGLSSGMYIVKMHAGSFNKSRKILYLK